MLSQLISDGLTAAERRRSVVDHLTARRISLMLLSQTDDPRFKPGLARFADDGAITLELERSLRRYALRDGHPHQPLACALLDYGVERGTDLGPVCTDFSARCDEADRVDAARRAGWPRPEADNPATAREDPDIASLRRVPRNRLRPFSFTIRAADWVKERYPEERENLYDVLRALKGEKPDAAPTTKPPTQAVPRIPRGLTPQELAYIRDEEFQDAWQLDLWEREHEIE